jgi:hypothetical protein
MISQLVRRQIYHKSRNLGSYCGLLQFTKSALRGELILSAQSHKMWCCEGIESRKSWLSQKAISPNVISPKLREHISRVLNPERSYSMSVSREPILQASASDPRASLDRCARSNPRRGANRPFACDKSGRRSPIPTITAQLRPQLSPKRKMRCTSHYPTLSGNAPKSACNFFGLVILSCHRCCNCENCRVSFWVYIVGLHNSQFRA